MLDHISDFYRIVHPEPPDALISQRKEAIGTFVEQLSDRELRYASADIAAFGLGPTPNARQTKAAHSIVAAIQGPQPSFSSDIAASPVDLRVFAGIAVAEHIKNSDDIATAALISSALETRLLPKERHIAEFLCALLEAARRTTESAAVEHRKRPELAIPPVQGTDVPTLAKSVKGAIDEFKAAVDQNVRADREELEILWYVFGAYSTSVGKPLQELDISQRVLASASELAELVIVPPMKRAAQFLYATVKAEHSLTLRQLVEPCSEVLLESVGRHTTETSDVLTNHPALLPIMWLSRRRLDSGMSSGWEAEFEQKTHISPIEDRTAFNWAAQVFNECVAARLLSAGEQV